MYYDYKICVGFVIYLYIFLLVSGFGNTCKYMEEIQTKVLRVFLLAIHNHLYSFAYRFYFCKLTQPLKVSRVQLLYTVKEKRGKLYRKPYSLPYGLRNLYRNLTSEKSQDYTQKPQRSCMFMNSAWGCFHYSFQPKKLLFLTRQRVAMLYFTKIGFGTSKYLIFSSAFGFSYLKICTTSLSLHRHIESEAISCIFGHFKYGQKQLFSISLPWNRSSFIAFP